MLHYYEGTVFNTPAQTLINTVNCFGVMGAGIALEFKLRYPEMFEDYKIKCEKKEMNVGRPRLYKYSDEIWIMNFPTKNHWKNPSKIQWVEEGLKYFAENYKKANIKSIAFPKLGTNNGGLDWKEVKIIMENYLSKIDIDVYICLDEKKEAEGIEKDMLEEFSKSSAEFFTNELKLTKKQAVLLEESIPVDRFWKLSKSKGVGEKTYEKVFRYYYDRALNKRNLQDAGNTSEQIRIVEQLSLF